VSYTEHVVYHLESLVFGRKVNGRDVRNHRVLGRGVIFEEGENWNDTRGRDVDNEFIFPYRELLNVLRHTRHEVLAILVEGDRFAGVLVGFVDYGSRQCAHRWILLAMGIRTGCRRDSVRGLGACRVSGGASWDTASLARRVVVAKVLCTHLWTDAAVFRDLLLLSRNTFLAVDIFAVEWSSLRPSGAVALPDAIEAMALKLYGLAL
jgi:hypothetical protein